jgi:hypothetical protein
MNRASTLELDQEGTLGFFVEGAKYTKQIAKAAPHSMHA